MELEVAIQERIQSMIDNGDVDELIETHAKSAINKIIENVFSQWGDFNKELTKVVSEKLEVNLKEIHLDTYGLMIQKIIEEELNNQVVEETRKKIVKQVHSITGKPEKQTWRLSEIVERFRDSINQFNDDSDQKEVVFESDQSYSSLWIRMGEKEENRSYSSNNQTYSLRMMLDEKTKVINGVWYDRKELDPRKGKIHNHTFEGFMMKLWANDCVLEIDQDEAEYVATKSRYDD